MAVKIVRDRRKNADGTYDIIHPETQAKAVWMSDGRSVEEAMASGGGGSGGADVLVVTCERGDEVFVGMYRLNNLSHTFAEVDAAVKAGQEVVLDVSYVSSYGDALIERLVLSYIMEGCYSFTTNDSYGGAEARWMGEMILYQYVQFARAGSENLEPLYAGAEYQAPGEYLLRNTRLASSDTTPTNNGEICWTYG